MVCTRGVPPKGARDPRLATNRFYAYALPFVWIAPPDKQAQGIDLHISERVRIAPESVDPRVKNYHWIDLVQSLFDAYDRGRDTSCVVDAQGHIAEGPGFNVFMVKDGTVHTADRGVLEGVSRRTAIELCARLGIPLRVAPLPAVEAIAPLVDERTRVVTVSSVAFHNGFTADLDAIGDLCVGRRVLFCVDAIQSIGVLPIDVRRANIAFLAADGHKWMCGSEGAAIFYVAAEHRDKLDVIENGWTNIDRRGKFILASTDLLPDARRFEAGSLNSSGVYGLRAAIDLLLEIGIETVAGRALAVATRLAERLEAIGWGVASPKPIASAIVGATPRGVERTLLQWHRYLEENGVVTAPREGLLRFSPHFYNDETEVERIIELLAR